MRVLVAVFGMLLLASVAPAHAASWSSKDCKSGPPKEWLQPRVTYTNGGTTWGAGYGSRASYTSYSARSSRSSYSSRTYR